MSDLWTQTNLYLLGAIVLLALSSVITRTVYFIFGDYVPLSESMRRALRYTPGAALAAILPAIDSHAAFGAIMGAVFVASTRADLPGWQRLLAFLFSALCGYGGAGEFIARDWAKQSFFPAMLVALTIVPVALRLMTLAPEFDASRVRGALAALFGGNAK